MAKFDYSGITGEVSPLYDEFGGTAIIEPYVGNAGDGLDGNVVPTYGAPIEADALYVLITEEERADFSLDERARALAIDPVPLNNAGVTLTTKDRLTVSGVLIELINVNRKAPAGIAVAYRVVGRV